MENGSLGTLLQLFQIFYAILVETFHNLFFLLSIPMVNPGEIELFVAAEDRTNDRAQIRRFEA